MACTKGATWQGSFRRAPMLRNLAVCSTSRPQATARLRQSSTLGAKPALAAVFAKDPFLEPPIGTACAAMSRAVRSVPLVSEKDLDFQALSDYLASGQFLEADEETRSLLKQLAGPEALRRGWVYFTEVKQMPTEDLKTIDTLWKASSDNKFGYSVQREIFLQNQKQWPKFFKQIDWVQGENNTYRKWPKEFLYTRDAVKGHLPLTNALRGTQLLQALLEHPAFKASKRSIEQASKEAASDLFSW